MKQQKEARKSQWFVECRDAFSNESLAAFLSERGIGEAEAKHVGLLDHRDQSHDVWEVPSRLIDSLRRIQRSDDRFHFRFFTRHNANTPIYLADFITKKGLSKKARELQRRLRALPSVSR